MLKVKLLMALVLIGMLGSGCSRDEESKMPSFSAIEISPNKAEYKVGDVVECTIRKTKDGSSELKKSSYWWYTSWWFADTEKEVDFQNFSEAGECVSSKITLTKSGEVKIYFFGQLQYPNYNWKKVEISKTILVKE